MKVLVLGGARSGKSAFALSLAGKLAPRGGRLFLATAEAGDEEMAARIAAHRAGRGPDWQTLEEPLDLAGALAEAREGRVILIDCLTLWLSNLLAAGRDFEAESARLIAALEGAPGHVVLVANEVGLGIVPENPLARRFRDLAGSLNQGLAGLADEVYFLAAGLPIKLK